MSIITNKVKCKKCGDIIESKHRHDFKYCKCGSIAVDGGHDYLRRIGSLEDYIELSEDDEKGTKTENTNFINKEKNIEDYQ